MIQNQNDKSVEGDLFFLYSFDLLAVVGRDGYFKRLNPSFERVLGYTAEELCARPIMAFLHPDDVAKVKSGIRNLAAGTSMIASTNRYRCKNGTYKWFSWNTIPQGELFYTVGRDITEQVNSDEHIRQLHLELESKNEDLEIEVQERVAELQHSEAQVQQLQKMDAIGRLAGGIAHDFNNILGAIRLYCDLLIEDNDLEAARKNAQDIVEVTNRAAALTRQLLIFSRKQVIQLETVQLNPLIRQLEKMLVRLIGENVKIVTKLAEDLEVIKADPSQMEQVILNLVVNARDAMPKGGAVTLETSNVWLDERFTSTHLSVNKGQYVLLSVSDEGTGMDEATLAKIFEPFFTTKPVGKGTGLGLTTTYGIVKQSQGTIWVDSEPGAGTVFKIYLPVTADAVQEPEFVPPQISEANGAETILLVEDDDKLRNGFSKVLRKRGYQVLVAANAIEALELCELHPGPIHLLLTDIVMPGLSGFELAQKALTVRSDLRVLYMSGYTSEALEHSGNEALVPIEFLQKPFSTAALAAKVQGIFAQGPSHRGPSR